MAENDQQTEGTATGGGNLRKPEEQQVTVASQGKASVKKGKFELQMEAIDFVLNGYEKEMATNKVIDANKGADWQLKLWRDVIRRVLAFEGIEFHKGYDHLLQFIDKHRGGMFNERYAYRFGDRLITLNQKDRIVYERVMNLMMMTSNPATRQAVLTRYDWTNLRRALQGTGIDEKLSEFYTVM